MNRERATEKGRRQIGMVYTERAWCLLDGDRTAVEFRSKEDAVRECQRGDIIGYVEARQVADSFWVRQVSGSAIGSGFEPVMNWKISATTILERYRIGNKKQLREV